MAIIVSQIETTLEQTNDEILEKARKLIRVKKEDIRGIYLLKSSVDARRKDRIRIISSVGIDVVGSEEQYVSPQTGNQIQIKKQTPIQFDCSGNPYQHPPVIVGFGPAGMFAGLTLARMGYCPIILERGADVDTRIEKVKQFWNNGMLDTETNVQFGEGGAGTFSDGKLTTRINDPRCGFIIEELIRHGAPEEIRHKQKPHVGTDLLRDIVRKIREEIIQLGGQVRFCEAVQDVLLRDGTVYAVKTSQGEIATNTLILAVGHSARDTFAMLLERGVQLEAKAFSVGVRMEQRQEIIDRGLYGKYAGHPALPKGEYQLSWRKGERGVYTFCMCPGGFVVPSSSEENQIVTNGMSEYARDGENANAALVVSVDQNDFGSAPLDGIQFQRKLEENAFIAGGKSYRAPAQSAKSFLENTKPNLQGLSVKPTFACGVEETDLRKLFPQEVNQMLESGLRLFEQRLKGFADSNAIMTGVETRTSSPVRITRSPDSLEAIGIMGLYPCGEGAGYAGGIISAAVDGVRVAQSIMAKGLPSKSNG